MEFELVYYDVLVQHFNHYATDVPVEVVVVVYKGNVGEDMNDKLDYIGKLEENKKMKWWRVMGKEINKNRRKKERTKENIEIIESAKKMNDYMMKGRENF